MHSSNEHFNCWVKFNKTLQTELNRHTQHLQQLTLDMDVFKSPQQNSMKANASVQTSLSPSSNVAEIPLVNPRLQRLHSTLQYGSGDSEFNLANEFTTTTVEGRGCYLGKQPIKIQFPCFGRLDYPLIFIEKCYDFMALHPLSDEELTAILRNVLHGTARNTWYVSFGLGWDVGLKQLLGRSLNPSLLLLFCQKTTRMS